MSVLNAFIDTYSSQHYLMALVVDIEDLRPVCPNCHAMIHRKNPPFTIEEINDSEKYLTIISTRTVKSVARYRHNTISEKELEAKKKIL